MTQRRLTATLDSLPEARREILAALKQSGPLTIAELAPRLGVSREAVRQQLVQLEGEGWIERHLERAGAARPGRPRGLFRLTPRGLTDQPLPPGAPAFEWEPEGESRGEGG